jgi:hypothetical protein
MTIEKDNIESTNNETELDLDLEVETPEEAPVEEKPERSLEDKLTYHQKQAEKLKKKLGVAEEKPESKSTGKLDETQLDYLDLKGISEEEDIKVIETVMKNTGKSLRDTLKDDYVVSTLNDNQSTRNVRNAIPGSSKRAGIESNSVDYYLNKFKSTGQLPQDFETRSKVVDALTAESNNKVPGFMRNL